MITINNKYGIWLRPDENLYGTNHDNLYIINKTNPNVIQWQSMRQPSTTENDEINLRILTNFSKEHIWKMYTIDPDQSIPTLDNDLLVDKNDYPVDRDDLILDQNDEIIGLSGDVFDKDLLVNFEHISEVKIFANSDICSYLECKQNLNISWIRLHSINSLFNTIYSPDKIVWMIQEHWTHDSKYAKSDTVKTTLWLDNFFVLEDGTEVWTDSKTGSNSLSRQELYCIQYETNNWSINIPDLNISTKYIYALYNSTELMLSYTVKDPLNIKYVIAKIFSRDQFEKMKLKNEDWSIYCT